MAATVAASTAASRAVSRWCAAERVGDGGDVDEELHRLLWSPSSGFCSSAVEPALLSSSLSPLVRCCRSLHELATQRGWSGLQLSTALHVLLSLHRACHSQPLLDGRLLCGLPVYSACRRQLLQLLLSVSTACPPFAFLVLSAADCQAFIRLTDTAYFPFLHLSQLAVHRTNRIRSSPAAVSSSSPAAAVAAAVSADSASAPMHDAAAEEERGKAGEKACEEENAQAGAPDRDGGVEAASASSSSPASPPLSVACQLALAELHGQFHAKLTSVVHSTPTATDPSSPHTHTP